MRQVTTFNPRPAIVWGRAYQVATGDDERAIGADWTIYNAPRPLSGTVTWESATQGQTGWFFAAVAPLSADPLADSWHDYNRRMDAARVLYLDRATELAAYLERSCATADDPAAVRAFYAKYPAALEADWAADWASR